MSEQEHEYLLKDCTQCNHKWGHFSPSSYITEEQLRLGLCQDCWNVHRGFCPRATIAVQFCWKRPTAVWLRGYCCPMLPVEVCKIVQDYYREEYSACRHISLGEFPFQDLLENLWEAEYMIVLSLTGDNRVLTIERECFRSSATFPSTFSFWLVQKMADCQELSWFKMQDFNSTELLKQEIARVRQQLKNVLAEARSWESELENLNQKLENTAAFQRWDEK